MVSTRHHPKPFPSPDLSPSKRSHQSSPSSTPPPRPRPGTWAHAPSQIALLWLLVSLPLVVWDVGYVLLRPATMPGGSLHWPLYVPYELYGRIDYVYGWKAYHAKDGFPAAQSALNVVESLLYAGYLCLVWKLGRPAMAVAKSREPAVASAVQRVWARRLVVRGSDGAAAVLLLFAASVMTVSKTVLYWLNEYYSGFSNISHNTPADLFFLWIIPNGLWILVPAYMLYISTLEILQGLTVAAGDTPILSDGSTLVKIE